MSLLKEPGNFDFVARAEVIKAGRTLSIVRADVFAVGAKAERELVATMQGTMMCLK